MSGEAVPSAPCPGSPGTLTGAVTMVTGVGDGTGPRTRALVGGMGGCWAPAPGLGGGGGGGAGHTREGCVCVCLSG